MEMQQVRYFVALAETLNFTRAAEKCNVSQPALTRAIQQLEHEDHSKDIDFSAEGIRRRREAGYRDTMETLNKAPWRKPVDELEGFVLHEAKGGEMVATPAGGGR